MNRLVPLLVLLSAITVAGCGRYGTSHAAVVEGRVIPFATLDAEVGRQDLSDEVRERLRTGGTAARNQLRRQVLMQLIRRHVVFAEVDRKKIAISGAEVDRRFAQHVASAGSRQRLMQQLAQQGLTESVFRDRIREDAELETLQQAVAPVAVGEADIRAAYARRRHLLEQLHLRHVVFSVQEQSQDQQALQRAQRTVQDLRAGADFASVARERSEDPSTAARGGDLGFLAVESLGEAVGTAVVRLRPGEISRPVRTGVGYHVFQLVARRPVSYDQAKQDLRREVTQQLRDAAFQDYVQRILRRARIEVNPILGDFDLRSLTIVDHLFFTRVSEKRSDPESVLGGG